MRKNQAKTVKYCKGVQHNYRLAKKITRHSTIQFHWLFNNRNATLIKAMFLSTHASTLINYSYIIFYMHSKSEIVNMYGI